MRNADINAPSQPSSAASLKLLTADDRVPSAKLVTGGEVAAIKHPVPRTMDGVGATPVHQLTVAFVIAPPEEADTCEVIFRAADEVMTPQCSYRLVSRCGKGRPSCAEACPCT
eukprot:SAG31_NODE_4618_length_3092_cov_2.884731_3_plen_113_part_00